MEQRYLIDTNAVIDAQIGKIPVSGMNFMASVLNKEFNISFISYIEFMGYKHITTESEAFIKLSNVIEINKNIIDICIFLRKTKRINLPDAIIAATAVYHNMIVISRNSKDFANIDNLKVIDPYTV